MSDFIIGVLLALLGGACVAHARRWRRKGLPRRTPKGDDPAEPAAPPFLLMPFSIGLLLLTVGVMLMALAIWGRAAG